MSIEKKNAEKLIAKTTKTIEAQKAKIGKLSRAVVIEKQTLKTLVATLKEQKAALKLVK